MSVKFARCNFDGKPINPKDQAAIDTFAIFLQMDDNEKRDAIRLDPQWQKFILGKEL